MFLLICILAKMRLSMLYSGEQILSFKPCLLFYAGDSLNKEFTYLLTYLHEMKKFIESDFMEMFMVLCPWVYGCCCSLY